jgi:hypothetical protein
VTETKDAGLYLLFYDCQMDEKKQKRKTTPAARPPINNWKKKETEIMSTHNRKRNFPLVRSFHLLI